MRSTIYKKTTGEIVMTAKGSENDCLFTLKTIGMADHSWIEALGDPATQYVDTEAEELRERMAFDVAADPATNTLSNIPSGTLVRLPDRSRVEIDASQKLTIEVDHRQVATFELRHPHYLDAEIAMECTP